MHRITASLANALFTITSLIQAEQPLPEPAVADAIKQVAPADKADLVSLLKRLHEIAQTESQPIEASLLPKMPCPVNELLAVTLQNPVKINDNAGQWFVGEIGTEDLGNVQMVLRFSSSVDRSSGDIEEVRLISTTGNWESSKITPGDSHWASFVEFFNRNNIGQVVQAALIA